MDEQNENVKTYTFKAETRQLLNILIHSLYRDREVFLRELLSNASDALNRLRFEKLTNADVFDKGAELNIHVSVNKDSKIITVTDSGIGMNAHDMIETLGTIAQSGARKFLESIKDRNADKAQVIGQFGVGFYSVFMVAEWVKVTSRSFRPTDEAATWFATGEDSYQIFPAQKTDRGTVIEIKLKEDAEEYADEYRLREIIRKHSDYISFPIFIGDEKEQANKQSALWRMPKSELTDDQYKDFYRQLTLDFEEPLLHFHSVTDAPVQFYALLYFPQKAERAVFSLRKDDGLKLYSKNILIDEYCKDLLPEHFRFVQGVVDSEDLPLNVSRESFQSNAMIARLKKAITGQVYKELENLAKNNTEKYNEFWQEFGVFLKQGIANNQPDNEKIHPLLRFKTSTSPESWASLEEYVSRMKEGQKAIYFIVADDPRSVLRSPHLDYYKTNNIEVLLLTDPIDSFMLMGLHKYKDFDLMNVAQASTDEEVKKDQAADEKEKQPEPAPEAQGLVELFKQQLGDRVADVKISSRLSQSVARLVEPEGGMNPEMQRVYRYLGREFTETKKILELNPSHPILQKLLTLAPESELRTLIVEQIFDGAMLVEGLHPDPSSMVNRVQDIIQAALKNQ